MEHQDVGFDCERILEALDALVKPIEHLWIRVARQFKANELCEHAHVAASVDYGLNLVVQESDRGVHVQDGVVFFERFLEKTEKNKFVTHCET